MATELNVQSLADAQLLLEVRALAAHERDATACLIAALAELDARRLYLGEGYSSLFTCCTHVLRLSEHAAYGRIEAARVARRYPTVLALLADGSINLTTVCLLAKHLTAANHAQVLDAARHKSKREVEQQVAALHPIADVPALVRKLPAAARSHAASPAPDASANVSRSAPPALADCPADKEAPLRPPVTSASRAVVAPLAPERYKIQMTVSRETYEKLRRAQDLLRHVAPDGDPAVVFDRALTLLVKDLEKTKLAQTDRPRPSALREGRGSRAIRSRYVPAAVRREVWRRDGGQCAFVGSAGRCAERAFLEFHHVVPFADGGPTTGDNLQLRCRAHNAYDAEHWFGPPMVREAPVGYGLGLDRVGITGRPIERRAAIL
jgi:hypothetical protein